MKTIPQGCRLDPVPWWDDDIDAAITLRAQLRKIRDDKNADPATLEVRASNYKTQVDATRELIRTKRTASWQKFATDNLRYSADSRRTASMIKILAKQSDHHRSRFSGMRTARVTTQTKLRPLPSIGFML